MCEEVTQVIDFFLFFFVLDEPPPKQNLFSGTESKPTWNLYLLFKPHICFTRSEFRQKLIANAFH